MAAAATMDETAEGDAEAAPAKRRMPGKKLVLFVLLPVLLLGGIGGGLMATGVLGGKKEDPAAKAQAEAEAAKARDAATVFYKLPDILVNLDASGKQPRFLKLASSFELENQTDVAEVEKLLPRILDQFQVYLRELRLEDLKGSAAVYRLRQELLTRVNASGTPVHVRDVLFREILIQ